MNSRKPRLPCGRTDTNDDRLQNATEPQLYLFSESQCDVQQVGDACNSHALSLHRMIQKRALSGLTRGNSRAATKSTERIDFESSTLDGFTNRHPTLPIFSQLPDVK